MRKWRSHGENLQSTMDMLLESHINLYRKPYQRIETYTWHDMSRAYVNCIYLSSSSPCRQAFVSLLSRARAPNIKPIKMRHPTHSIILTLPHTCHSSIVLCPYSPVFLLQRTVRKRGGGGGRGSGSKTSNPYPTALS